MRTREQIMDEWSDVCAAIESGACSDAHTEWLEKILDEYDEALRSDAIIAEMYKRDTPSHGNPLADDMGGPGGDIYDWRKYTEFMRHLWPKLTRETRMAVSLLAQQLADKEKWD